MLDELRLSGRYAGLAARAADKARKLAAAPRCPPPFPQLLDWYFRQRLGEEIPGDLDALARDLGLNGRVELDRLLGNDWLYYRIEETPAGE